MKTLNCFSEWLKKLPPVPFFLVMLTITINYFNLLSNIFWGDYVIVSKERLLEKMLQEPLIALSEEFWWRWFPFVIASIIWWKYFQKKNPKIGIIVLSITMIIIQLWFGFTHIFWDENTRVILGGSAKPDWIEQTKHILWQGGLGILLAFTYLKYLLQSERIFKYIQIIPLIVCIIIHMINNQIVLYLRSF